MVLRPVDMIAVADARALEVTTGSLEANLDPTQTDQWPGARHNRQTDLLFADSHAISAKRKDVIDPGNQSWRARWNNDNQPHMEIKWSVDWSTEASQP
jgi:hypothetical protein